MPTPTDTISLNLTPEQFYVMARLLLKGMTRLDKQTDRTVEPCKEIRAAVNVERKRLHELDKLMDDAYTASGRLVNDLVYWEGVRG